jgi:hypothetical protein
MGFLRFAGTMPKLVIPQGKSLYHEATFDVRRRLQETFQRFNIGTSKEIVGESLLRFERICRKNLKYSKGFPMGDNQTETLFEMLKFYKSLK